MRIATKAADCYNAVNSRLHCRPLVLARPMRPEEFVRNIDHTLLTPEATPQGIDRLCDEALEHNFHSVFVNPVFVDRAVKRLDRSNTVVGSVAGFPLGASHPTTVADEARRTIEAGGREVDMVLWIGGLIAGKKGRIVETIHAAACVVHGAGRDCVLKVILETTALTDEQAILGCRCSPGGEADFVKTSTGVHPSGGATVEHVRLLHRYASPLKVKASGGIRNLATALAMLDAGADRLGTSSAISIVRELRERVEP